MAGSSQDIAAVEAVVRAVWARFLAHDKDGMLALLDERCTVWDVFEPDLVTKATMRAYVDGDYDQKAKRGALTFRQSNFVTDVWSDMALVRFNSFAEYAPPNPHKGEGRTTVVLRRIAEGWRLVHVHEGRLPIGVPPIVE
ncbi:MAG: nuclear transport factor 2 family protein [Proteobacteria bacterium]|nr:nuclear transport factor 2 family protein [Pseudomonadota bacterium]MDA1057328.1 nuclear transport factor 2 family protein [Pseudomonadota bacterium]